MHLPLGFEKAADFNAPPMRTENCVPYFLTRGEDTRWNIHRVDGLPTTP